MIPWVGALALASLLAPQNARAADPSPAVDLDAYMVVVREANQGDMEAWSRYSFQRKVIRRRYDGGGHLEDREVLVFQITPTGPGSFDEELVSIDGEDPTERQKRHHRKLGRFAKHYQTVVSGEASGKMTEEHGYSFRYLLGLGTYRYAGSETIDGIPCHRITFEPSGEEDGDSIAERISHAMAGTLWVTREGGHLYKAEARTVRSVGVALGLAGLDDLEVSYQAVSVADGTWLPQRIVVDAYTRILFNDLRKLNTYTYADYRKVR